MEYKYQPGQFLEGTNPMLHTCYYNSLLTIQNSVVTKSNFSEKAKAFSIDALLNKDDSKDHQKTKRHSHNKTSACQQLNFDDKIQFKDTNSQQTREFLSNPEDVTSYEDFSQGLKKASKKIKLEQPYQLPIRVKTTSDPLHMLQTGFYNQIPATYFSPMMTGGFFRPDECFSPMSSENHTTPSGLKSCNNVPLSAERLQNNYLTQDCKNQDSSKAEGSFTPMENKNYTNVSSRKAISFLRSERPHPYLSARHRYTTPNNTDTELQYSPAEQTSSGKTSKVKRHRTAFTPEQLLALEAEFEKQQYLVGNERIDFADSLNLTVTQVKVWFQNRRIKWRKEQFGQGTSQQ